MPSRRRNADDAACLRRARAEARDAFQNKVEEHVGGALLDFYRALLAMKNGRIRWVEQWTREVFLAVEHRLLCAVIHDGSGLKDGARAFKEAIANVRKQDRWQGAIALALSAEISKAARGRLHLLRRMLLGNGPEGTPSRLIRWAARAA